MLLVQDYKFGEDTPGMFLLIPLDNGLSTLPWKLLVSVPPGRYRIPKANCPLLLLPGIDQRVQLSILRGAETLSTTGSPIFIRQGIRQADLPEDMQLC